MTVPRLAATNEGIGTTGPSDPPDEWPITVVARWKDPGYSERDAILWLAMAIGCLWVLGSTLVLEGRAYWPLLVIAGLLVGRLAWQRIRARPQDLEMIVSPDRLRVRDLAAGTPTFQLARRDAAWLLAAETGVDWQERLLVLADGSGAELFRLRARKATVTIPEGRVADESWWHLHMPSRTSPAKPPTDLSVTALLASWWPRPDQRMSVRGNLSLRLPWKDGDLATYEAWTRRQRRLNGLLVLGLVGFVLALMIPSTWPWTAGEAIAIFPPIAMLLGWGVRSLLHSYRE